VGGDIVDPDLTRGRVPHGAGTIRGACIVLERPPGETGTQKCTTIVGGKQKETEHDSVGMAMHAGNSQRGVREAID
jgi:hypothetical protein